MTTKRRWALAAVLVAVCGGLSAAWALQSKPAPRSKVDVGAFAKEMLAMKIAGDRTHLSLWYPMEFFVAAQQDEPGTTPEQVEKDLAPLKNYLVIMARADQNKEDGTTAYQPEKDLRSRAVLRLSDGKEVSPIAKPPPAVSAIVAGMKAYVGPEDYPETKNTHFLVFPAEQDGKPIVNSKAKDKLTLVLKASGAWPEAVFTWRTPFDAMSPAAPCAKCKGELSAKWSYCPWCGTKAPEAAAK